MKLKVHKTIYNYESNTCKNCGQVFSGKVCNNCGEKVFHEKQLSAGHYLHEVIDFFYHFENKVLKTIKLNILKPGFITAENLRGVRVPYAKPVQLYLVVAVLFYIIVSKVGVTDYIPQFGDHKYYYVSDYRILKWTSPLDNWVVSRIDTMWANKGTEIQQSLAQQYNATGTGKAPIQLYAKNKADSLIIPAAKTDIYLYQQMRMYRWSMFHAKIGTFAKTFIFILLPVIAGFFFLLFFKKIKYYGSALILSTHFMVYNLCAYAVYAVVNIWPLFINKKLGGWMFKPFNWLLYNKYLEPVSTFIIGEPFEMVHMIFWMPWLFVAFKSLFRVSWWKNLLISYFCCKVFFFLIFGVLKKLLIVFTIWTMHA